MKHIPHETIERRYRRFISILMWSCSLSHTEAVCCVRMYLDGFLFGPEAVDHMGGPQTCVKHAVTCRNHFASMGTTDTYRSILMRAGYYAEVAA